MKRKNKGLFSISEIESKYFNDKEGFIELESCPKGGMNCTEHITLINKKMSKSRNLILNKDFERAIEELKIAYFKTTDLAEPSCLKCAELFRSTITKSLEVIQKDLQKMTTGIFKAKRFNSSYELATNVLKEFKEGI
jgi:hypothetical protein